MARQAGAFFAAVAMLCACSDGDGDARGPVKLGPGADKAAVEEVADKRTPEPAWARAVPSIPGESSDTPAASAFAARAASAAASSSSAGQQATYRGTMTIDVAYYGYDCSTFPNITNTDLHHLGDRTYEMPVEVVRGPRSTVDGSREHNPFNLSVGADTGNEAGIQLLSATTAPDERDGKLVLFEYWRITQRDSRLEGRFVEGWRLAGLGANVLPTSRLNVPCMPQLGWSPLTLQPIAEGAELTGTVTDSRVDLTVVGQTLDKERAFRARIKTSRVKARSASSTTTSPESGDNE